MSRYIQFSNYSPAADIVVTAVCFVMLILVFFSNISRTRSFKLFVVMVVLVLSAAWADITFYTFAMAPSLVRAATWTRCVYHALLLLIFVYYIAYICEVTCYEKQRFFLVAANLLLVAALAADIVTTARGAGFSVDREGVHFVRRGIFIYAYVGYAAMSFYLMTRVQRLLYRRIMLGFYGTIAVSFCLLVVQGLSDQASFTVASLMLPVVAVMYVLHSNPTTRSSARTTPRPCRTLSATAARKSASSCL